MKILNLIWKYGTGGIPKCFETYSKLGEFDPSVDVKSVCIDPQCFNYDRSKFTKLGIVCIKTKNQYDMSWHSALADMIKSYTPDVIFTHGFHGPMIYLITKIIHHLHVPLIASYHGLYYAPTKNKKWIAPLINQLTMCMYKHCCERIVAVSYYSKRELEKHGIKGGKVCVVHNGIHDIPIKDGHKGKNDSVNIGVVSRLDPFKGIDILIDALAEVKKRTISKIMLDIVGNGPMDTAIKERVRQKGLENEVRLLGYRSDVSEMMNEWDVFCLPTFFENHSLAILEAMRAGKAIVTTDVGGNSESVTNRKEALLVPAHDVESLSEALIKVVNDEVLRVMLGKNARERFEREFTEDKMKTDLIKALTL